MCFISIGLYGQQHSGIFHGARTMRMAYIYTQSSGIHSCWNNQAGLADLESLSIVLGIENKFEIPALSTYQIAFGSPIKKYATVAFNFQQFGDDVFIQQKASLAIARKLFSNLNIAIQFDRLNTRIEGHGKRHNYTFELGLQSSITEKFKSAFHLFNPIRSTIIEDRFIPSKMSWGIFYSITKNILLAVEVEKNSALPYQLKLAMEVKLKQNFGFSLGTYNEGRAFNIGSGIYLAYKKKYIMDLAIVYNQYLGLSSGINLEFAF